MVLEATWQQGKVKRLQWNEGVFEWMPHLWDVTTQRIYKEPKKLPWKCSWSCGVAIAVVFPMWSWLLSAVLSCAYSAAKYSSYWGYSNAFYYLPTPFNVPVAGMPTKELKWESGRLDWETYRVRLHSLERKAFLSNKTFQMYDEQQQIWWRRQFKLWPELWKVPRGSHYSEAFLWY